MAIKIENRASIAVKALDEQITTALELVPTEHLRGFSRVIVVDRIEDSRLTKEQTENLPALYHPKTPGSSTAFGEIALLVLMPPEAGRVKRMLARAQLKANLAQMTLTLVAQHHLFTVANRKKRGGELERAARDYVERYFAVWRERQGGRRARLFKPLMPLMERWQKAVRKRYADEARRKAAS